MSVVLVGLERIQPGQQTEPNKNISTNCFIHTVVPPDDAPRYAKNMYRLTKYTENMICIKVVFLHVYYSVS